jgi:hypothetical protein
VNAVAISNNDMVYLHWSIPAKIPGCLGFSVIRHEAGGQRPTTLPAMVGFKTDGQDNKQEAGKRFEDTDIWPVQKYSWKDLFAKRGGTYWYEIVPMIGTPGNLRRDDSRSMRTNSVSLDPKHGDCSVFFNRGIISTQAIARASEIEGWAAEHRGAEKENRQAGRSDPRAPGWRSRRRGFAAPRPCRQRRR